MKIKIIKSLSLPLLLVVLFLIAGKASSFNTVFAVTSACFTRVHLSYGDLLPEPGSTEGLSECNGCSGWASNPTCVNFTTCAMCTDNTATRVAASDYASCNACDRSNDVCIAQGNEYGEGDYAYYDAANTICARCSSGVMVQVDNVDGNCTGPLTPTPIPTKTPTPTSVSTPTPIVTSPTPTSIVRVGNCNIGNERCENNGSPIFYRCNTDESWETASRFSCTFGNCFQNDENNINCVMNNITNECEIGEQKCYDSSAFASHYWTCKNIPGEGNKWVDEYCSDSKTCDDSSGGIQCIDPNPTPINTTYDTSCSTWEASLGKRIPRLDGHRCENNTSITCEGGYETASKNCTDYRMSCNSDFGECRAEGDNECAIGNKTCSIGNSLWLCQATSEDGNNWTAIPCGSDEECIKYSDTSASCQPAPTPTPPQPTASLGNLGSCTLSEFDNRVSKCTGYSIYATCNLNSTQNNWNLFDWSHDECDTGQECKNNSDNTRADCVDIVEPTVIPTPTLVVKCTIGNEECTYDNNLIRCQSTPSDGNNWTKIPCGSDKECVEHNNTSASCEPAPTPTPSPPQPTTVPDHTPVNPTALECAWNENTEFKVCKDGDIYKCSKPWNKLTYEWRKVEECNEEICQQDGRKASCEADNGQSPGEIPCEWDENRSYEICTGERSYSTCDANPAVSSNDWIWQSRTCKENEKCTQGENQVSCDEVENISECEEAGYFCSTNTDYACTDTLRGSIPKKDGGKGYSCEGSSTGRNVCCTNHL